MPAAAIRRKDLKHDEFVSGAARLSRWLMQRRRRIGWALLVVVVGISAMAGMYLYRQHQAQKASALLAAALEIYNAPVVAPVTANGGAERQAAEPQSGGTAAGAGAAVGTDEHGPAGHLHYPSEAAKYEAARAALRPIVEDYGRRAAGRMAAFYLGLCEAELGNHDEAVRQLEAAADASQPLIASMALYRLGFLHLEHNEAEQAVGRFEDLLGADGGVFPREEALMGKAKAHEAAGDDRAALAAYQRIVDEYSTSLVATDARARVEELSARLDLNPGAERL